MLLAMDGLLKQAQLERRAIGSFNVYNGETIRGAVQAAGKTKLPMIISFGAGYLRNMDLEEVVYLVHRLTAGEGQFVLHLDHCGHARSSFVSPFSCNSCKAASRGSTFSVSTR